MKKIMSFLLAMVAVNLLFPYSASGDFAAGFTAYEKGDYKTAFKNWLPLAEQGHPVAQFNLGIMYYNGKGVPQKYSEAAKWYLKAAEQGYANAQNNLGEMYNRGEGVQKNDFEAVKWYQKAAEQGVGISQGQLGYFYANGKGGLQKDLVKAHMWSNLAAAQGNKQARENRDIFAKYMTPTQIAKAQQMAREWRPKKPAKIVSAPSKQSSGHQTPTKKAMPRKVRSKREPPLTQAQMEEVISEFFAE